MPGLVQPQIPSPLPAQILPGGGGGSSAPPCCSAHVRGADPPSAEQESSPPSISKPSNAKISGEAVEPPSRAQHIYSCTPRRPYHPTPGDTHNRHATRPTTAHPQFAYTHHSYRDIAPPTAPTPSQHHDLAGGHATANDSAFVCAVAPGASILSGPGSSGQREGVPAPLPRLGHRRHAGEDRREHRAVPKQPRQQPAASPPFHQAVFPAPPRPPYCHPPPWARDLARPHRPPSPPRPPLPAGVDRPRANAIANAQLDPRCDDPAWPPP